MSTLKGASIDILVTLFIIVATAMNLGWGRGALWVYTALMFLLKIAALSSTGLRQLTQQKRKTGPPLWVYHGLYGINVIALGLRDWWYLFIAWGLIWIISILIERRG